MPKGGDIFFFFFSFLFAWASFDWEYLAADFSRHKILETVCGSKPFALPGTVIVALCYTPCVPLSFEESDLILI